MPADRLTLYYRGTDRTGSRRRNAQTASTGGSSLYIHKLFGGGHPLRLHVREGSPSSYRPQGGFGQESAADKGGDEQCRGKICLLYTISAFRARRGRRGVDGASPVAGLLAVWTRLELKSEGFREVEVWQNSIYARSWLRQQKHRRHRASRKRRHRHRDRSGVRLIVYEPTIR